MQKIDNFWVEKIFINIYINFLRNLQMYFILLSFLYFNISFLITDSHPFYPVFKVDGNKYLISYVFHRQCLFIIKFADRYIPNVFSMYKHSNNNNKISLFWFDLRWINLQSSCQFENTFIKNTYSKSFLDLWSIENLKS